MAYATITPSQLIAKFEQALSEKWGYIWGKTHEQWTAAKQEAYAKAYANDSNRAQSVKYGSKWIGHWVTDCSGLFAWAFKDLGSYMYHGSNTMYKSYCVNRGTLKNGKRSDGNTPVPGTAVFTGNESNKGHVGLYVGNGTVIEAAGSQQGVKTSLLTASKWKYWGELKYVDYSGTTTEKKEETAVAKEGVSVSYPTLKYGAKGEVVSQLQDLLAKAGSGLEIDGIFGVGTRTAVRSFQSKYGLEVDGIVGPKTWTKLLEVAGNIKMTSTETKPVEQELTLEQKVDILWKAYQANK